MNLKSIVQPIVLGVSGISATEIAEPVISSVANDPSNVFTAITQVIIAIATLFGLFKKKKH